MTEMAVMTRVTYDAQNKRFIIVRRFKNGEVDASVALPGSDLYHFLYNNPRTYFTPYRNKEVSE